MLAQDFYNFIFKNDFFYKQLANIYQDSKKYIKEDIGKGEKINIEYGSPNPTGPVHIGHTRGAIYGDILANILEFIGYHITRENYINDAGKQIDILAKSLFIRYREIATKKTEKIPEGFYPGDYLIPPAEELYKKYQDKLLSLDENKYLEICKACAISSMLQLIKDGFAKLNIYHDVYFSELSLHNDNKLDEATQLLKKQNNVYMGVLEKPKGIPNDDWHAKEQLLFKAKEFGDDVDRAVQRSDKSWTYFAADCAYHYNKFTRGFNKMILILGADHGGYVKRMKALVKAISSDKAEIDINYVNWLIFYKMVKSLKCLKDLEIILQ